MKTRDSFPYIVEIKSTLSYRATKEFILIFLLENPGKDEAPYPKVHYR